LLRESELAKIILELQIIPGIKLAKNVHCTQIASLNTMLGLQILIPAPIAELCTEGQFLFWPRPSHIQSFKPLHGVIWLTVRSESGFLDGLSILVAYSMFSEISLLQQRQSHTLSCLATRGVKSIPVPK
jgi:hypothetical protein